MEHLLVRELVEFSASRRVRKRLLDSGKMMAELLCYEPGQGTPVYNHPAHDEMFYLVEGSTRVLVGDEEASTHPTSPIPVLAQTRHGLVATTVSS